MTPSSVHVLLAALAISFSVAGQPSADAPKSSEVKVVILGDSTVSNYPPSSSFRGWGQMIGKAFKEGVVVSNLAVSGRSTKTFLAEGRLKKALAEKADFALIQFGHNDSHRKGNPESTDAETTYRENLRIYVDAFRSAGTQPILVTPMHRRTFQRGSLTTELKPYADAVKAVAAEKKVPVVDLYARSGELFEALGEDRSADLNGAPKDRTHFSEKGAQAMADLVVRELKTACPSLGSALR